MIEMIIIFTVFILTFAGWLVLMSQMIFPREIEKKAAVLDMQKQVELELS